MHSGAALEYFIIDFFLKVNKKKHTGELRQNQLGTTVKTKCKLVMSDVKC